VVILYTHRICNFIDSLISLARLLFTESYLSETDNIVPFENTTLINRNKKVKIKKNAEQVDQVDGHAGQTL